MDNPTKTQSDYLSHCWLNVLHVTNKPNLIIFQYETTTTISCNGNSNNKSVVQIYKFLSKKCRGRGVLSTSIYTQSKASQVQQSKYHVMCTKIKLKLFTLQQYKYNTSNWSSSPLLTFTIPVGEKGVPWSEPRPTGFLELEVNLAQPVSSNCSQEPKHKSTGKTLLTQFWTFREHCSTINYSITCYILENTVFKDKDIFPKNNYFIFNSKKITAEKYFPKGLLFWVSRSKRLTFI